MKYTNGVLVIMRGGHLGGRMLRGLGSGGASYRLLGGWSGI